MNTTTTQTPAVAPPPRNLPAFFQSPVGRLGSLLLLWLLLQIPLEMISGLVQERQTRRDEAAADVTSKWGGSQQLFGPVLRVPYIEHGKTSDGKPTQSRRAAYLLPETLVIDAKLATEDRRRGIFSVPVYGADLNIRGHFQRPDLDAWIGVGNEPVGEQAELQIGLSDVRAIHADGRLIWLGKPHGFEPSAGTGATASGVHVGLGGDGTTLFDIGGQAGFALTLRFNGSDSLQLAPVGRDTKATITADWDSPSFQGGWLPTSSTIDDGRFTGNWSISYLGRGYPQQWTSDGDLSVEPITRQLFGVALLSPVDAYRMSERVTKYAVLAAFFTFVTIWLTEVLAKRRVHVVQYVLIGAALTLFGLLQLAIGEHFGFEPGFVCATIAVTAMVTFYSKAVLERWRSAFTVGALLGGLYGYLYLLLSAEDYALLGGSVALFIGLALVMLLTRKIDWHRIGG